MVSIIWTDGDGAASFDETKDLGSGSPGDSPSDNFLVYIRHTGENQITNCKLYIAPFSEGYVGDINPQSDYDEIINKDLGTLQVNLNASGGFPSIDWKDISTLADQGTKASNAIPLDNILNGLKPNFRFATRFSFASSITANTGTRYFDFVLTYTYTS